MHAGLTAEKPTACAKDLDLHQHTHTNTNTKPIYTLRPIDMHTQIHTGTSYTQTHTSPRPPFNSLEIHHRLSQIFSLHTQTCIHAYTHSHTHTYIIKCSDRLLITRALNQASQITSISAISVASPASPPGASLEQRCP